MQFYFFSDWKGNNCCNTTRCKPTQEKKNPNKLCQVKPTKQEVKIRCFHCSVKSPPVKCKMLQPGDRSSASARSTRLYKGTLSWKITDEVYFSDKWLPAQTARQSRGLWLRHWSALRCRNSAPGIWGTSMLPLSAKSPGEESISHVSVCFKFNWKTFLVSAPALVVFHRTLGLQYWWGEKLSLCSKFLHEFRGVLMILVLRI